MKIRIDEVARRARVSPTTVSHALNGKGRVSEATRAHVIRVAAEMRYTGNAHARGLRTGREMSLGFQVSELGRERTLLHSSYAIDLLNGAARAGLEDGYSLTLVPPGITDEQARQLRIDGAIIIDPTTPGPLYDAILDQDYPLVTTGRFTKQDNRSVRWVDNDFQASARKLLTHLADRGYERPAVVTSNKRFSYELDVIYGYRSWAVRNQVAPRVTTINVGSKSARRAVQQLVEDNEIDAIVSTHEELAIEVLHAAQVLGRNIPNELGVVSLADSARLATAAVPLTALELYPRRIGREAVRLLIATIKGERVDEQSVNVPTRIIARASTRRFD